LIAPRAIEYSCQRCVRQHEMQNHQPRPQGRNLGLSCLRRARNTDGQDAQPFIFLCPDSSQTRSARIILQAARGSRAPSRQHVHEQRTKRPYWPCFEQREPNHPTLPHLLVVFVYSNLSPSFMEYIHIYNELVRSRHLRTPAWLPNGGARSLSFALADSSP
jgi:hypothetical protein